MYLRREYIEDGQPEDEAVTPELGPVALRVEAEHLLDDYWWLTATPAGTDPDDAAMAVVRITDSRHPLRYRAGYSARIS